jgi:cation diffusion facilitator family transporter
MQQDQQVDEHVHPAKGGPLGWLAAIFHLHGHDHEHGGHDAGTDSALATQDGIRTVWIALAALGLATVLQIVIVILSGSVALLADTVHNLGDALNSVPLLLAFYLTRRAATRRYTYGYGRAEDVAGVIIVISIIFSAGYILWESFGKLLDPQPIERLPWVAAAAVIGFVGNEAVALFQIRTGRRIGSDALVADGLHARIDGLTSLVVLIAVAGSALGYPIVDPLVGLAIGFAIVLIARDATRRIWYRLMDAVDPDVVDQIEQCVGAVPGVAEVDGIRVRWVGHELQAQVGIIISDERTLAESHEIVATVRETLLSDVRHLSLITVELLPGSSTRQPVAPNSVAASPVSIVQPHDPDPNDRDSAAVRFDERRDAALDE